MLGHFGPKWVIGEAGSLVLEASCGDRSDVRSWRFCDTRGSSRMAVRAEGPKLKRHITWWLPSARLIVGPKMEDGIEFLAFAAQNGIETRTKTYPLDQANSALADLRAGRLEGAAVLIPPS